MLGSKHFPINIIQGPLAGVSTAPFRVLSWRYSQPAFTCTEMISCKTIIHQSSLAAQRYTYKDPAEGALCFQLSGTDPYELGEAVKIVSAGGADLIDLNCGCPVKKIRSRGAGSSLLMNPSKLYHLITAMKKNTSVPVSIKIRVEGKNEKFKHELLQAVHDAGADFLIVHGRHWTEHYETPCCHDAIQFFVEEANIPVIGNGDIACVASLKKMLATGCAGVMIARAGVGQPWLIKKLVAEYQGEKFIMPSLPEIGALFVEHVEGLAILLKSEKFAVLQARKMAKYYARTMIERAAFVAAANASETLAEFKAICRKYFTI